MDIQKENWYDKYISFMYIMLKENLVHDSLWELWTFFCTKKLK